MDVSDHCLGTSTEREDSAALYCEIKGKCLESTKATIDRLITDYQLVSMQDGESVTQYVDRVGLMENLPAAAGKIFDEEERIKIILRGLLQKFATTRDLARELQKRYSEVIAMIVEKEAELSPVANQSPPKVPNTSTYCSVRESVQKGS